MYPRSNGQDHARLVVYLVGCAACIVAGCTLVLDPDALANGPVVGMDAGARDASVRDSGGGAGDGASRADSATRLDAAMRVDAALVCDTAADCDDGRFCSGVESCDPGAAEADTMGCISGDPPCAGTCDDDLDACVEICSSGVVRLGVCRRECSSSAGCVSDEVCVDGACLPSVEACGGCAEGVCPAMTPCRSAAGSCDLPDVCDGTTDACLDARQGPSTVCRPGAGACDVEERCDGSAVECPSDLRRSASFTCRASAGGCDMPELCDGSSADCPSDAFLGSTVVCAPAVGPCDLEERCSGSSATCPANLLRAPGFVCRASAGGCDLVETCTGTSADCPIDRVRPSGFECRGVAGSCDVAERCDGTGGTCPIDAFVSAGTTCRVGSGDVCDPSESCSGSSPGCPSDAVAPSSVICRPGASACDPDESCPGVAGMSCPADTTSFACPGATSCVGGLCRLPSSHALVFVSSATRAAPSSRAASDAMCQSLANARRLGGTFVALMSDSSSEARDRVVDRAYHRIDDALVASSRADMFDGSLANLINLTEQGGAPAFGVVITGSLSDGRRGETCGDWAVTGGSASHHYGLWNDTRSGFWISANTALCFGSSHVICIQTD